MNKNIDRIKSIVHKYKYGSEDYLVDHLLASGCTVPAFELGHNLIIRNENAFNDGLNHEYTIVHVINRKCEDYSELHYIAKCDEFKDTYKEFITFTDQDIHRYDANIDFKFIIFHEPKMISFK